MMLVGFYQGEKNSGMLCTTTPAESQLECLSLSDRQCTCNEHNTGLQFILSS